MQVHVMGLCKTACSQAAGSICGKAAHCLGRASTEVTWVLHCFVVCCCLTLFDVTLPAEINMPNAAVQLQRC